MFDENTPTPPEGLPTAPASEGTAPAPTPPPAPAAPTVAPAPAVTPAPTIITPPTTPRPPRKKGRLKVFLVVVLAIVIIGVAGYIAYNLIVQPAQEDGVVTSIDDSEIIDDEDQIITDQSTLEELEPEIIDIDSDGDGLLDSEEERYGTDPFNPDTDQDGLGDREETQVYDTDPLNPDTDGDSYLDGQEVAGGFNPNGEGKLFELPK